MKTLGTLTLVLASACVAETTSTTESELGLKPTGGSGSHFYWAAYEQQPYIYKGCPEPGPEPWAERATLYIEPGTRTIELELGTAVPLEVRALSVPRGMTIMGHSRGATISHEDTWVGDPFTLLVTSGRCSYEIEAEIAF